MGREVYGFGGIVETAVLSLLYTVQRDHISSFSQPISFFRLSAPQCALIGFCKSTLPLSRNAGQSN